MNSNIRHLIENDLPEVIGLSHELGYPDELELFRRRFFVLSKLSHHALYVYEDKDGVHGFMHLEAVDDLIEKGKVEIKAMIIKEEKRGLKIGKTMIEKAKEWARANGLDTIYLSCNSVREKAHTFYQREGFTLVKTSHFFEMGI